MADNHDDDEYSFDDELLDDFSSKLEECINKVCDNNPGKDPRRELLVSLGIYSAQVAFDSGLSKEQFLKFMSDMFDDYEAADAMVENFDEIPPIFAEKKDDRFKLN